MRERRGGSEDDLAGRLPFASHTCSRSFLVFVMKLAGQSRNSLLGAPDVSINPLFREPFGIQKGVR